MSNARRLAGDDAMAELASVIGEDGARSLARRLGGTTIYVPRAVGEHHPLRAALGEETAARFIAWYGGSRVNIPKQPERHARVRELHRAGTLTVAAIAVETNFSERQVYRIIRDADDGQLDLFDGN